MQPKDTRESAAHGRRRAIGFVQRLLQRVKSSGTVTQADESTFEELQPPGRRSGNGVESLAPYLDQFRGTRPASLD
jgi:hypothetical protein